MLLEKPEGVGRVKTKLVSGSKAVTGCANRGGGGGWQAMGTEVPLPSGRHKAVHLSMWDKAPETGGNKPCTRKERTRTEGSEEKKVWNKLGGKKHKMGSRNAGDAPELDDGPARWWSSGLGYMLRCPAGTLCFPKV